MVMFLEENSTPIVGFDSKLNLSSANRVKSYVFPTPESPIMISFIRRS